MDIFPVVPKGEVKTTYQWNSKIITFESEKKSYYRKRIKAKKTYSFTVSGTKFNLLVDFYNKQKGLLVPFYFTYDGITELCHFSQAISPKYIRELGSTKAYSCDVSLEVVKQASSYPSPNGNDMLPPARGELNVEYNWNTSVLTLGENTDRREKSSKVFRKITGNWSGSKKDRDLIISLFNSHCRSPLKFNFDGNIVNVMFPDSLEITDIREMSTIVGYKCSIELEVVD